MANTGTKIVTQLRLWDLNADDWFDPPTFKPNLPVDADYIPPYENLTSCPIDDEIECTPVSFSTTAADALTFEFSLSRSTLNVSGLTMVRVVLKKDGIPTESMDFNDLEPNYFRGTFDGLEPDTYQLTFEFYNGEVSLGSCIDVASWIHDPVVTWEGIDPYCEVEGVCSVGVYDEDSDTCTETDSVAPTPPSVGEENAALVTNVQWHNGGAQVFNPGYSVNGSGTIAATLITPHFWVNGNFQWDTAGRNLADSRMNVAGIWVDGETSDPLNEWIGFSQVISTPVSKTYWMAISSDNEFRVYVDGNEVLNCPGNVNGVPNFAYLNIYPIVLAQGYHIIEMWGKNTSSVAGMVMEIYDMTYADLIAATEEADLNILFSTMDMAGQPFHLGDTIGYSCPAGYSLVYDGLSSACVQITTTAADHENTGDLAYENRRRVVDGTPDGFEEPNIDGEGIGDYIAPIEDLITCPLP